MCSQSAWSRRATDEDSSLERREEKQGCDGGVGRLGERRDDMLLVAWVGE